MAKGPRKKKNDIGTILAGSSPRTPEMKGKKGGPGPKPSLVRSGEGEKKEKLNCPAEAP